MDRAEQLKEHVKEGKTGKLNALAWSAWIESKRKFRELLISI